MLQSLLYFQKAKVGIASIHQNLRTLKRNRTRTVKTKQNHIDKQLNNWHSNVIFFKRIRTLNVINIFK